MLLVVLGAGASYDSAPSKPPSDSRHINLPDRPPLANELFGDRPYFGKVMNKYPQCLPIIPRLRHITNESSVERELQKLQTEAPAYPERYQQLAAIRYYLQDILWMTGNNWLNETQQVSNYSTLVDSVKRWKKPDEQVCFVTFNYDTLLDRALRNAGYSFDELSGYVARDLMLVKLHGSVNWARIVNLPDERSLSGAALTENLVKQHATLNISRNFCMFNEFPFPRYKDKPVFPALAIPVESKLDFECPDTHVDALRSFLPKVRRILVIGWRATEQPFLEILKQGVRDAGPAIMIVNGSKEASEGAADNIRRSRMPANYKTLDVGFTSFIVNDLGKAFLSSS